jgi:hypothetical protein
VIHVGVINMACKYVFTEMCDTHIIYGHRYIKEYEAVVYQDVFPSHHTPDRKYFVDWWVTLGKEDICVY